MSDLADVVERLNTVRDILPIEFPVAAEPTQLAVPRWRFDEVCDRNRQLHAEIDALRVEIAQLRTVAGSAPADTH